MPSMTKIGLFEVKFDGYRALAYKRWEDDIKLLTRNYKDVADIFPEIKQALSNLPGQFILDGEIIVLDETHKSNFEYAQKRGNRRTKEAIAEGVKNFPALYIVYDIMYRGIANFLLGDLKKQPLFKRKQLLKELFQNHLPYQGNTLELAFTRNETGIELYDRIIQENQEGMIAKNIHSTYQAGKRSKDWLKIFPTYIETFYICGYTKIESILKEGIGSLHICEQQIIRPIADPLFVYRGKVGTGFSLQQRRNLEDTLNSMITSKPLITAPKNLKNTKWVAPFLTCRIKYKNKTPDGKLRHPVFLNM